jgi:hypothetical protein
MIVPGVIQTGELNDLFRGMLSAPNFERERMLHCLTPGHQHATLSYGKNDGTPFVGNDHQRERARGSRRPAV